MDNELVRSEEIKDWLVKVRREFHMCPELGMEELKTSEKICYYLDEMGIEYQKNIAKTGIVGIIKGKKEGKTVALRADMDALPIEEMNDVEYKSKNKGKMHACGHDAHMTILLGTAKILNEMKDDLKGNVKLIFQPAEETVGGAKPMIKEGVMENPKVDEIFGLHVAPEIPVGKIGVKYDKMNASSDTLNINIYGESTHGAYPHGGIDAIMITGNVITALQSIVSRNLNPLESAVVSLGTINGGTQHNIIANKINMRGTVRTLSPEVRKKVIERVDNIVTNIPKTFGGKGEFIREEGYAALINHDDMVELVRKNAEELLGKENVVVIDEPSLGVEDFAYFLNETKGAYYRLGCRNEKKGIIYDGHHNRFNIDENCLPIGVAIQLRNVIKTLGE